MPRLQALSRPEKIIPPGTYRVYIAPEALAEFVPFFSWNGLGERSMREGESAWRALREGRRTMSPLFRVSQDFSLGVEPRFNELAEAAPERLVLVEAGKLAATVVSTRSAKQYGVASNAAPEDERVRSLAIDAGQPRRGEGRARRSARACTSRTCTTSTGATTTPAGSRA